VKLGIGSYTFTWACGVPGHPGPPRPMTPVDLVDRAAGYGLHLIQICDNLPLAAMTSAQLDDLSCRASEQGVAIELGTRGIGRENLATHLRLAARLGSRLLRVVVDTADEHPSEDEVVRRLGAMLPDFEAADVVLAIENHDRFKARILARIVERLGSDHAGICLDTVNSFGALEGPDVVVETLAPYTVNLHVKDFVVQRVPHSMGFVVEGRPAGEGMLDVPWLLSELARHGRDVNAVLELWTPPGPTLQDTLDREKAWTARSVGYLRTLIPN